MLLNNISIHSIAHVEAPLRMHSSEIATRLASTLQRLGMRPDLLENVAGIQERRLWNPEHQPSDAATFAVQKVLEKSGLSKNDIGALISTSVSKDFIEPSVASTVHGNLGMSPECMNFDLGNACLAFLNGIHIAATMIEKGHMNHAIVVAGESAREIIENTLLRLEKDTVTKQQFREQFATLTLGSGAVAMIISRSDLAPNGHVVRGFVSLAATEHNNLCRGWNDHMKTDAQGLLFAGLDLAQRTYQKAEAELGWKADQFDEIAVHQVSLVHTAKLIEMLEMDENKVLTTFGLFGNMGPASLPFVMSKLDESGRLSKGKRLAMMGIGSGINCMMMDVLW